jgi:hypothetical protein
MSQLGSGNCNSKNSEVGFDGQCYALCPPGWTALDNGPICAKNCPSGFAPVNDAGGTPICIKPQFLREEKPNLQCPIGADRLYERCYLDCPVGTQKDYNLCVPVCPSGFMETLDGLSCQAEFVKRSATVREACYSNETRIGGRTCLAPCPAGTAPFDQNIELCYSIVPPSVRPFFWTGASTFSNKVNVDESTGPLIAKVIFARTQTDATCLTGFEPLNGSCYANCGKGSSNLGTQCVADCPSGFKNVDNLTACERPTQTRPIVRSVAQSIGYWIGYIIFVVLAILFFSFVLSLLR